MNILTEPFNPDTLACASRILVSSADDFDILKFFVQANLQTSSDIGIFQIIHIQGWQTYSEEQQVKNADRKGVEGSS